MHDVHKPAHSEWCRSDIAHSEKKVSILDPLKMDGMADGTQKYRKAHLRSINGTFGHILMRKKKKVVGELIDSNL